MGPAPFNDPYANGDARCSQRRRYPVINEISRPGTITLVARTNQFCGWVLG